MCASRVKVTFVECLPEFVERLPLMKCQSYILKRYIRKSASHLEVSKLHSWSASQKIKGKRYSLTGGSHACPHVGVPNPQRVPDLKECTDGQTSITHG
jgi:hypothetical protein